MVACHGLVETQMPKSAFIILLLALFFVCGSALRAENSSSAPADWPGAGKAQDWYAACGLDRQASDLLKDLCKPGSTTVDRGVANKSIALYKKAIAKYPYETAFYDNLAKLYNDLGDARQAEANYRKSVEVKEKYRGPQKTLRYADTYLSLARLCVKHNKPEDAEKNFKKACEHYKTKECFTEYAAFLKQHNRLDESTALMKKADELQKQYDQNKFSK